MSMPWFRMYAEVAGDPVIQSLAFEDQRHYFILLCLKCNGTLDRQIAPRIRESVICRGLGLDPNSAQEAKRRLMEVSLIDKDWQPLGWEKRQYASDGSTERVRNYRKQKKAGNVSETLHVTDAARYRNGPDTDTEADTEKELKDGSSEHRSEPSSPVVITLPLNDGTPYPIHEHQVRFWRGLYPAVDIEQQLRKMLGYFTATPQKRKTRAGILRCVNTWLAKEQDRGGLPHETHPRPSNSAVDRVRRANGLAAPRVIDGDATEITEPETSDAD